MQKKHKRATAVKKIPRSKVDVRQQKETKGKTSEHVFSSLLGSLGAL